MLEVWKLGLNTCDSKLQPLEEEEITNRINRFKYLGSQVAADGGCGAQNE